MFQIHIPAREWIDENTMEFKSFKGQTIQLEHSLVSMSKWEAIWHIPFLSKEKKTEDQIKSYIKCMTITQNVSDETYNNLSKENVQEIQEYIDDPHTATRFNQHGSGKYAKTSSEQLTSELIYYYMTELNIPFECQRWNLNRLMTLIHICAIKKDPKGRKKMPTKDVYAQNAKLNAARRAAMGSKG